jgi:hypothetical protein
MPPSGRRQGNGGRRRSTRGNRHVAGKPKLSKLLNGSDEGARYFLDEPDRARALEWALGVGAGWLARLREVLVLVLDPALPEVTRSDLKEREGHGEERLEPERLLGRGLRPRRAGAPPWADVDGPRCRTMATSAEGSLT